ncbi:MAG: ABC transporter permease subunit [Gemmataceae bacterium]|nr:ABC transporter permease subunit [Gemmataceae bacterium]
MRWSIIRLIWLRELRDQLRDRRTLFMVAVLPLLLYPVLGFAVLQFALGFQQKPSVVGIVVGAGEKREFPRRQPDRAGLSMTPHLAWLASNPVFPQPPAAVAFAEAGHLVLDFPALLDDGEFTAVARRSLFEHPHLLLAKEKLRIKWLEHFDQELLSEKGVDLILTAPADFYERLEGSAGLPRPIVEFHYRPGDDYSKQAKNRIFVMLDYWKRDLKQARLARKNLPADFDDSFEIQEPAQTRAATPSEHLFNLFVRIFPFMLVMWSLAGALYPAVDLCAGEKERGTMETLLITPAGREEIVLGKFLTIWVFSTASALINLASMGVTTWRFSSYLPQGAMPVGALCWSVLLSVPLAALFSAISLAIGAYARSSKEGQYYLMPLFLITMPLIFLTLAPGVELNPFYSLVPVTGVALLMQKLMLAPSLAQVPWLYFVPVLAPVALYSWLALKWAIEQFKREEVLFREAERVDLRLWLRSLFQEKTATPSAAQAAFCFGLIIGLRWLTMGMGRNVDLFVFNSISLVALVAAPPLLMALLLNTKLRDSTFLRLPHWKEIGLAAVLAVLLLPPLAALTLAVFSHFPNLTKLLEDRHPLMQHLRSLQEGVELQQGFALLPFLLAFALLPAICEEIAFRGYILSGLLRRFRPRTSILFCSFLFALYHMNVFQFLPSFFLGVVLGLLTVRSKSLVPAMFFHFLHNGVLFVSIYQVRAAEHSIPAFLATMWPYIVAACLAAAAALLWWLYRKPYVELEQKLEKEMAEKQRSALV